MGIRKHTILIFFFFFFFKLSTRNPSKELNIKKIFMPRPIKKQTNKQKNIYFSFWDTPKTSVKLNMKLF